MTKLKYLLLSLLLILGLSAPTIADMNIVTVPDGLDVTVDGAYGLECETDSSNNYIDITCTSSSIDLVLKALEADTDGEEVANIVANGKDGGGTETTFAEITFAIVEADNLSEAGNIEFKVMDSGTLTKKLWIDDGAIEVYDTVEIYQGTTKILELAGNLDPMGLGSATANGFAVYGDDGDLSAIIGSYPDVDIGLGDGIGISAFTLKQNWNDNGSLSLFALADVNGNNVFDFMLLETTLVGGVYSASQHYKPTANITQIHQYWYDSQDENESWTITYDATNHYYRMYGEVDGGTTPGICIGSSSSTANFMTLANGAFFTGDLEAAGNSYFGGGAGHLKISSDGIISHESGNSGYIPKVVAQDAQPTPTASHIYIWRDTDDNKVYLIYNDSVNGVVKIELT